MEYTVENLEKAVMLFYKTETGQQAEAHQWLTEAQNSPQAWSFVWELLDPRRSSEIQFFAATTLHTKLLKCWNEIPIDHYELLKKRILEAIVSYAMGPKLVLNRLCITLSAYIIHTVPVHWPNAFEELVSSFQPRHLPNVEPERVIWILLEILSVIPEEFQSTTLAVSQKNRVRTILHQVTKDILKVVEMCLLPVTGGGYSMDNLMTYLNSTRCACAWIKLGGITVEECSHIMNLLVDLACYVYWNRLEVECMSSEELDLTEVAIEALSAVMLQPQTMNYPKHVLTHTSNILDKFGKILENECQIGDPNKDIVANIYGLIITAADTHAKLFIGFLKSNDSEEKKLSRNILNCILNCSNLAGMYPVDESSSSLPFGFWYTLQDDILSFDTVKCAELLLIVKPYYRQLVCVLLRKSMHPNTWEDSPTSNWSLDDKEMFRCYRQDVADTFMYCYNVLNLEMLDILQSKLTEALDECNRNSVLHWNSVESCLHAFAAISECIEWENLYLPKLMLTIKNIPYRSLHIKVLATALDTIGAYSEWLSDHPETLNNVIPLLISGLGNAEVSPNTTLALKDVSQNCQKYLQPYADHLLIACESVLKSGQLRLAERIRIMHSVGIILSILSIDKIMEYLNIIVGASINEIEALVKSESNIGVVASLITRLKMLSALFATLHVKPGASTDMTISKQPILVVVQNTLPLYVEISKVYFANTEMMEVLCELLKHVITTLMDDCKVVIPNILQLLLTAYVQVPQASILLLSKTILVMFEKDEEFVFMLQQFLFELHNKSLQMCAQLNNNNQLSEKCDVFENFFSMLTHVSKRNSKLLFNSRIECEALFQCAIICLALPEVQTLKACTAFLVNFISLSRENDQAHVIQKCGENLVHRILLNLGGSTPRSTADILSDILLVLNKKYCDSLYTWLNIQLRQEGFPSQLVTMQQKENFMKIVLREKANKRKLSESVTEFVLICRGIIKADVS